MGWIMRHVLLTFCLALAAGSLTAQKPEALPTPDAVARAIAQQRATFTKRGAARDDGVLRGLTASPAKRIWASDKALEDVWFRRTIELPAPCKSARLVFSCDNECTVFVNTQEVGSCTDHGDLVVVDIPPPDKGRLTLAVRGKNTGGPGALVLWLLWEDGDGTHELVTDADWRINTSEVEKWTSPALDDTGWDLASADQQTDFGKNTYNGAPVHIRVVNQLTQAADAIDEALAALRAAEDRSAALKALDDLDRAVVRARDAAWKLRAPEQAAK